MTGRGTSEPVRLSPNGHFPDGELVLEPIEDEANVDVRRAEVGLHSLVEYVEQLKRLVSSPR